MMTNATPSLADRCTIALDGMREEMAAQGVRKGPAGALLKAILRLLEAFVALLAEFKAGTLANPSRSCVSTPPPKLIRFSQPDTTAEAGEGQESPADPCPGCRCHHRRRGGGAPESPLTLPLRGSLRLPQGNKERCARRTRAALSANRGESTPRSRIAPRTAFATDGCLRPHTDCLPRAPIRCMGRFAAAKRASKVSYQIQKNGLSMRGFRANILFRYQNENIWSAGQNQPHVNAVGGLRPIFPLNADITYCAGVLIRESIQ
jgi:hypothetical protein